PRRCSRRSRAREAGAVGRGAGGDDPRLRALGPRCPPRPVPRPPSVARPELVRGRRLSLGRRSSVARVLQRTAWNTATAADPKTPAGVSLRPVETLTYRSSPWPPSTASAATAQSAVTAPTATDRPE